MNTKSFLAGSLAALTIFSFAGGRLLSAAPVANAATEAEMQAQIAALLAQIAALQAQMGTGSSSSCYTFTTDLTLGSNSEAVRALQVYLNNKGYIVATAGVGSKGNETTYFGGLTRAALAKYQAAMGISPAAGYFGPITRAKVNADCTPGTGNGNGNGSGSGTLEGGEADLTNFNLRSEEADGNEGESDVEAFTAEFDVEDGDVRVERMEIMASSASTTLSTKPWDYFDAVSVWSDGKKIADMDVDSRDDWDEEDDDVYRLTLSDLDTIVREDDTAELTVAFDIADNIDSDDQAQEFTFFIENDGIRARDGAGIDQYTGKTSDTVDFGFGAEENGDLKIKSSSDDPSSMILVSDDEDESDEYTVFAFDVDNDDDVDSVITDLTIGVTTTVNTPVDDVIRHATLKVGGDEFDGDITATGIDFDDIDANVDGDDTTGFELMVTLVRNATSTGITFDVDSSDVDAEGADSGDDASVSGSATSETHTIAAQGIAVEAVSTDASVVTLDPASSSYGQYTIKFKVTAVDDDAYISTTTDSSTAGNEGVAFTITGSGAFTGTSSALLTSTADTSNGFFVVDEGDTETFTLTVTLDPSSSGIFEVDLSTITFNDVSSYTNASIFTIDGDDEDFQTDPINIPS